MEVATLADPDKVPVCTLAESVVAVPTKEEFCVMTSDGWYAAVAPDVVGIYSITRAEGPVVGNDVENDTVDPE